MPKYIYKIQANPQRLRLYKDDLNLIKYDDYKVKLSLLSRIKSFNGLFIDMETKENSLQLRRILNIRK